MILISHWRNSRNTLHEAPARHAYVCMVYRGESQSQWRGEKFNRRPGKSEFLSIASLWEMSIKVSIGKLELGMTFIELVEREVYGNAIELLEIQPEHLDELAKLPFHHKDPFDRLIIAQSLAEHIPVVTKDGAFGNYPVTILW